MRRLFYAAFASMLLGVASGLFYREFTKGNDFTGDTQLALVHTHLLALGMTVFLILLALEKLFAVAESPLFGWFFWVYSAGILVTTGAMTAQGILAVLGLEHSAAVAGIAGLGHIALLVGLVLYFVALRPKVLAARPAAAATEPAATAAVVTGR
ncbi:DUF2871 domain-containing protein [Microterricola pindariensis]|uniref:DUF2871 domain-containing protein n=1 Tax=Microterricola pindariensis TaxID=478010 RepID=A0ABX5B0J9_9MICO|nr:DUF2871 domain-containing protein [Microterricola pindariensis]PPL20166.1 hypothetical protein GY24_02285 [Microterricola pindariensis]